MAGAVADGDPRGRRRGALAFTAPGRLPGALAERLAFPAGSLKVRPDSVDSTLGALVEPGGNALFQKSGSRPSEIGCRFSVSCGWLKSTCPAIAWATSTIRNRLPK